MNLPSGTVTFLFTDIEGSTKLWEEHPDAMRVALARHDALMRAAIEGHNGHVFKTIGDAFCAAFHTAPDALNAALAAQQALLAEPWPEPISLKVRMAVYTGEAQTRDNDYFGQPLNRAARLLGTGHGGQVLLSSVTCALCGDALPASCTLQSLGEHRLRDLSRPETFFQLRHPDLPSEFPPLKSLDYLPNNLPLQLTSFIGREKEIAEVKSLLPRCRLLTLTGSGGCGKTRLALQVAAEVSEQYPDGVWLVELAPLVDPGLTPQTVATALRLKEQAGQSLQQTLIDYLQPRSLLLLLDNCEHLLSACATLSDTLLRACPHLKILATSREGLGIGGELTYRVPSLGLPDLHQSLHVEEVGQYEAVRLFIERAQFQKPEFAVTDHNTTALASVCRRLDGIPLAIELAAARVRSLSVDEIDTRLDNRFRLLTGGSKSALPRQQTLRALIDWSYDLLNAQERLLLARLSVFAGGWTLEAAEFVCAEQGRGKREEGRGNARDTQTERAALRQPRGERAGTWEQEEGRKDEKAGEREGASEPISLPSSLFPLPSDDVLDLLTSLVDKSLVIADTQGETTRYRLLETVRQYAQDRLLESGESMGGRGRYRDYFLALAEKANPLLSGSEQAHWLAALEEEHDNLRQALRFCLEDPEGGGAGLRLGGALQRFWWTRGHLSEGRQQLAAVLARPVAPEHRRAHANALNGAGVLANMQGAYAVARALLEESLAIRRELADKPGIAASLGNLGNVVWTQGDYAAARALHEESLAIKRELGDKRGIAESLNGLGLVAFAQNDVATARTLHEESLAIRRELADKQGIAISLNNLGFVAQSQDDHDVARTLHEESLMISRELGARRDIAAALMNLGRVASLQGDDVAARAQYQESLTISRELGDGWNITASLGNLGLMAVRQGDYAAAFALFEECLAISRKMGSRQRVAVVLMNLGRVAALQGDYAAAHSFHKESLAISRELTDTYSVANSLDAYASLALQEQQTMRAARLCGAATSIRATLGYSSPPEYDQQIAQVRSELETDAFTAAFEEGCAMTWEQAVTYALETAS